MAYNDMKLNDNAIHMITMTVDLLHLAGKIHLRSYITDNKETRIAIAKWRSFIIFTKAQQTSVGLAMFVSMK